MKSLGPNLLILYHPLIISLAKKIANFNYVNYLSKINVK